MILELLYSGSSLNGTSARPAPAYCLLLLDRLPTLPLNYGAISP